MYVFAKLAGKIPFEHLLDTFRKKNRKNTRNSNMLEKESSNKGRIPHKREEAPKRDRNPLKQRKNP